MKTFAWLGHRRSVRRHLIVWNTFAIALLFVGLGAVARFTVQSLLIKSVDDDLRKRMEGMVKETGRLLVENPDLFRRRRQERGREPESKGFQPALFDLSGAPVLGSTRHPLDSLAFEEAKRGRHSQRTIVVDGRPVRTITVPVPAESRMPIAVAQDAYPLDDVYRTLGSLNLAGLALLPAAVLFSVLGSVWVTGRVLGRIGQMNRTVDDLKAEDLSSRLPVEGNDEFSGLAVSFNGMLGRVESAFLEQARALEQQRRFTADASHELRTPLTVIKGSASLALKSGSDFEPALTEIDRSADAMTKLVDDLLLLARFDGGRLGRNQIDVMLREVLDRSIATVKLARPDACICLAGGDSEIIVHGNESELLRLFTNLIDNAARHGKHVTVSFDDGPDIRTVVQDDGEGIAPQHIAHLGERFYRVDESRTGAHGGTGLGLSICKSIVEAHQGKLVIESKLGAGTTITVWLPKC